MLAETARPPAELPEGQVPWWPSRYGPDDQLGSLNEITPAKVVQAARLVRQGKTFDLGRVLDQHVPRFPGRFWQQTLVSNAHLANPRREGGTDGGWGKNQVNWLIELATGTFQIGIETVPPIVTRGVLVDVAGARGVARLEAGDVIGVEELEAILHAQRTPV